MAAYYGLLEKMITENQFVQLALISSATYICGIIVNYAYRIFVLPFVRGFKSSITVYNSDTNFNAVVDYISTELLSKVTGGHNSLMAVTEMKQKKSRKDWINEWLGMPEKDVPKFDFRPDSDQSIHTIIYKGSNVYLERIKSSTPLMGSNSDKPFTPEQLTLSIWGSNNSQILKDLLNEAVTFYQVSKSSKSINIYTQSSSSWLTAWELAMTKSGRSKDSVILDENIADEILEDAKKFLGAGKWYSDLGIPYRRGYLLHGPPGTGKTSFAQVLACELKLDICMLNLTHEGISDASLAEYLRDAPKASIIVLEDVDAVFVERDSVGGKASSSKKGEGGGVSFSGLLNAIDGVASQEGRIFFMTTNHIEKLDPALIRPGRCDMKFQLKNASKTQMEKMFLRFFPGEEDLSEEFSSRLPPYEISLAALQGHFLRKSITAQEAVDTTVTLLQSTKPVIESKRSIFEHLSRVGLENYANLFTFYGIHSAEDLKEKKIDDLICFSHELRFDFEAQRLLDLLIKNDQNFILSSYQLVDVQNTRDSFLNHYKNLSNNTFLSHKNYKEKDLRSRSSTISSSVNIPPKLGVAFSYSADLTETNDDYSLDALSKLFCNYLIKNGKGLISKFRMKSLLDNHPNHPFEAVLAAKYLSKRLSKQNDVQDLVLNDDGEEKALNLFNFCKRAGVADFFNEIEDEFSNIDLLLDAGFKASSIQEFSKTFTRLGMDEDSALNFSEILMKKHTWRGGFVKFNLPNQDRVISFFIEFFLKSKAYIENEKFLPSFDKNKNVDEKKKQVEEDGMKSLENWAFDFAVQVTNQNFISYVSLLEIENYLKKFQSDPLAAIDSENIDGKVLSCVKKERSVKETPKDPDDFVFKFILSLGKESEFKNYAQAFLDQGFSEKDDLLLGDIPNNHLLSSTFNCKILAHAYKIQKALKNFREENIEVKKENGKKLEESE